jgi:hypothetical protein
MSTRRKSQATVQQMGGKGNLKPAPKKMANSKKSASKKGC